ncbi:MAG: hypothetical protein KGM49_11150 [Sphingomonadales bacterium]|nr:hypothetical protein [Sphingomonadales bacterium]
MAHFLRAAFAIASLSSSAIAQAPPNGWEAYQFGMSIQQVQAVPNSSWDKLQEDQDGWGGTDGYSLKSLTPVTMNGRSAEFTVYFDATGHLNEFEFKRQLPANGCEAAFKVELRQLEHAYGTFVPSMVNSTHSAVRNAPGGKSKYVAITETRDEPIQQFLAERRQQGRFLNVSADQDKAACNVDIWLELDR